jgi:hypothetical protein
LLGTVISERATDLIMLVLLLLTVVLIRIEFFGKFIAEFLQKNFLVPVQNSFSEMNGASIWTWILVIAILVAPFAVYYILRDRIKSIRGVDKLKRIVKGVVSGIKTILHLRRKYLFISLTLLLWLLYLLTTWILFFSIESTSGLSPADGLFILVFATIGMTLPVQGGFGTYHLLVSLALTLYGIPREEGLLYAFISHESQTLMFIILGTFSMIIVFLSGREKSELKTNLNGTDRDLKTKDQNH